MSARFIGCFAALAMVTTFGAGCAEPEEQPEEQELASSGIIGGDIDEGHRAVAMLRFLVPGGNSTCTGTLIAAKTVVTAAHCLTSDVTGGGAFFGTEGGEAEESDFIPITARIPHPEYDAKTNLDPDIAVVLLERSPKNITPMPIIRGTLGEAAVGSKGTAVGFGNTKGGVYSGHNMKRQVSIRINDLEEFGLHYGRPGKTTCQGDSGGPQLFKIDGRETVVSVTSRGFLNCTGDTIGTRVDRFLGFLSPYLDAASGGTSDGDVLRGSVGQGDVDSYKFEGKKAKIVFNASGDAIITVSYVGGQQTSTSGTLNVSTSTKGTFSILVRSPSGSTQSYTLRVETE